MTFTETRIAGAWLATTVEHRDPRGCFERVWCSRSLAERGLEARFQQCNLSCTRHAGTIRGLHYQLPPHAEAKFVRCQRGAIFDVVVDLRPDSASYLQWLGVTLSRDNRTMLYVPEGCAHGYQTLTDDAEVLYAATALYEPAAERGIRWDDSVFGIEWPLPPNGQVSEKDQSWPNHAAAV